MKDKRKINLIDSQIEERQYYNKIIQKTDHLTGEVLSTDEMSLSRGKKRENFFKLYVENLFFMATELNSIEKIAFLIILTQVNYKNTVHITSDLREIIENAAGMSRASYFKAIKGLKEKDVLLVPREEDFIDDELFKITITKNSYLVNPNLIGKGSFKDLKKLRQVTSAEFNFETFDVSMVKTKELIYDGFEETKQELLEGKSEIVGINQSYDEKNNVQRTDIKIADVEEENHGDYSIVTLNEVPEKDVEQENNIIAFEIEQNRLKKAELDLRLLEAQNKKTELEIENKKLDIELKKLEKKENNQGTLF